MSAWIIRYLGSFDNLLGDFRNVDSACTQKRYHDSEVVYSLLEDEEPDGIS